MKNHFKPDFFAERVLDIDFERLAGMGVKAIVFDADNTLLSYDESTPAKEIKVLCDGLKKSGFYVCILSNGHSKRIKSIARDLELEFVGDALKPLKKGFRDCAKKSGIGPDRTVVVGDQIFTDIWGAGRAGCLSVLVRPIDLKNEPGFVKFKRLIEKNFIERIYSDSTKIGRRI